MNDKIKTVNLVAGLNTPIFFGRGKWTLSFLADTWDTAVIKLRSILSEDPDDFTESTELTEPNSTNKIQISANRGELVFEGPGCIAPHVGTIGTATGLKMRYGFSG